MNEDIEALAVNDTRPCINCGEQAEPERDGDYLYFACECGTEFGYTRVTAVDDENDCQVGVPEHIRRLGSDNPLSEEEALEVRRKAFLHRITMGQQ